MSNLQPVRGTHDLLGNGFRLHQSVIRRAEEIAGRYGFQPMTPPVFEFTEVFSRTLGETSDVVTKEMYTFEDRGGDSITLRPEFTAGVARAFMSNGLAQHAPVKVFASGPVFRHERPQKGRLRQFHQIDVEVLGVPGPAADIEVIAVGAHILEELGLLANTTLRINSLGDPESRASYRENLLTYLEPHKERLSRDSRERLYKNPLRIFDSKDGGDQAIMADAPLLNEHLNDHSAGLFADVLAGLDALGISYQVNHRLVRGLDYYSHTAFEFVTGKLGAQGAVLAGGRYDGLMEQMGGKATPGVGWAAGVERLSMMIAEAGEAETSPGPIALIPMGGAAGEKALTLASTLRKAGYRIEQGYSGNMKKRLQRANKINAAAAILLGDDELAKGVATVRDMASGKQAEVALDNLMDHLIPYR